VTSRKSLKELGSEILWVWKTPAEILHQQSDPVLCSLLENSKTNNRQLVREAVLPLGYMWTMCYWTCVFLSEVLLLSCLNALVGNLYLYEYVPEGWLECCFQKVLDF
jgi:hypothetical protein